METKRIRTKSATWRKGETPGGVKYYFARKPVFKARDFVEKPVKAKPPGAKPKNARSNRPLAVRKTKAKAKAG